MKVAYDSRPARTWNGVGRYAACLLDALGASRLGEIVETRDPRRGEVFHSPWIEGAPLRSPVPSVVTLHDLIPLKRPGDYLRTGLRFKLRYLAVQRATMVIVPTRTVADDAMAVLEIPADRIEVIPEAAAPAFWRRSAEEVAAVRERYGLPDQYLLWVGTMRRPDPRKRVAALARAERTMPLVLVGPVSRWARELPGVQVTGAVPDDELAAIYSGAHALVFPSDEEGFGLPPVEALACGTPVAACDVPALREVLAGPGDADRRQRPRRPRPSRRGALAPGAATAPVDLGRRRRGHLGGLRAGPGAPVDGTAPGSGRGAQPQRRRAGTPRLNQATAAQRSMAQRPRLPVAREQETLAQEHVAKRRQLVGGHPWQIADNTGCPRPVKLTAKGPKRIHALLKKLIGRRYRTGDVLLVSFTAKGLHRERARITIRSGRKPLVTRA